MRSTSLGKQRASRRSHRNGAVCRFLAALGASVILGFGVGAPVAAAQSARQVPLRDGGGGAPRADQRGHGGERLERLVQQVLAGHRDNRGTQSQSTNAGVNSLVAVPPLPVAVPPLNLPNIVGSIPGVPGGATAATARRNRASAGAATSAGAGGAPAAISPSFAPTAPATVPRSPVARALRTAQSYGALLALAAAVVAFLMIQGRVDRRDPRILSAPAEDRLSFRDFE
jgi:hypothetical protein